MPFFLWSRTPAGNATADSTCAFPEGMAPSALNDGMRGVMARLREFADDGAGAIVTTGTATAYGLASFEGFDTLAHLDRQVIAFTPHATSGTPATLNVDSLGARPLRLAPGIDIPAGTLVQGTPYVALYNNSDGCFYIRNFLSLPYMVPIGGLMPFVSLTPPNSSFVLPYGQAISRTIYAALFALIGTSFGVGDGATTFNIPDLRGRVPVPPDNMGGSAAGRVTTAGSGVDGATVGATGGAQNVTLARANLPNVAPTFTGTSGAVTVSGPGIGTNRNGSVSNAGGIIGIQSNGNDGSASGYFTPAGMVESLSGGVAQTATNNMPPAIILPYILRVI